MIIEVTDQNFGEEVLESDLPTAVDFWAPGCAPCDVVSPISDKLSEEYKGRFKFCKVNIDENPQTAAKYQTTSIPMQMFFKNGQLIDHIVGVAPEHIIRSKVETLLELTVELPMKQEDIAMVAITEVSIIPIGTKTPSVSKYVAQSLKPLMDEDIKVALTPMSTVIEGDLDKVLSLVRQMHENAFSDDVMRVITTIKIDDRRDKPSSIGDKIESLKRKLES